MSRNRHGEGVLGRGFEIPNAAYPTGGMGLTLELNGHLPDAVKQTLPGYVYAYVAFTANVSVTATTPATSQTVVTAGSVLFPDGDVWVEFFAPRYKRGTTVMDVNLWNDATEIGELINVDLALSPAATLKKRVTLTAGAHELAVKAYVDAGTGRVDAGDGTGDNFVPGYILVTKA